MSSPYESSWFNLLRAEGAVLTTSPGSVDAETGMTALFGRKFGTKRRRKKRGKETKEKSNQSHDRRRYGDIL